MFKEHDLVVLTRRMPKKGLKAGDVGTVIHIHPNGQAYEVGFTTLDGKTTSVVTLEAKQLRPVGKREITHVREWDPSGDMKYGDYLVAYLDLLGQREKMRKLEQIPLDESGQTETEAILRKTAGFVLILRDWFHEMFLTMSPPTDKIDSLPEDKGQLAEQMSRMDPLYHGFSDSSIIAVRITYDNKHGGATNGIYAALFAACATQLMSLSNGHALRGGIDFGPGLQITEGEVYGPALERAYILESKEADYARIIVGEWLLAYLSWVASRFPITRKLSEKVKRLTAPDSDGHQILDYLGSEFRLRVQSSPAGKQAAEDVQKAYEFVTKEHERFTRAGDSKLASRYAKLRAYFEGRRSIWGF